jgi:hypothetical protein
MLSRAVQRARNKSARLPWPASRRSLQSAAAASVSPPLAASDSTTVTLLRQLDALLQSYPLLESAWPLRIAAAVEKSADPSRPATIAGQFPLFLIGLLLSPWRGLTSAVGAVVGERDSGVSQLVTTLLDDPLASDDRVALTLESRRLDPNAPEAILIRSVFFSRWIPGERLLTKSTNLQIRPRRQSRGRTGDGSFDLARRHQGGAGRDCTRRQVEFNGLNPALHTR